MKISIIVPLYNEEKTIGEIIKRVVEVDLGREIEKEIVVVDDGSTDNSPQIVNSLLNDPAIGKQTTIKFIRHSKNLGKGAAVRRGIRESSGDLLLIQDADLEYDPCDIPKLLEPIRKGKAEVVYGSRFRGERRNMLFWHILGNKFLSFVTNLLYNTTLSDMEVGYKLFKKEALRGIWLKENRWGFDPEITGKVLKKGIRIYEVPISYAGREYEKGKKIYWKDGLRILWVLFRVRFLN